MATFLGDKNVGDIVKIAENGILANFIIVHKGLPSEMYDDSCNGVWLLREQAHTAMAFDAYNNNDYETSDVHVWLGSEYYNSIDPIIRERIKQVKIPFKKGNGGASTGVQSGSDGLSCAVFLLSGYEVGFTQTDHYCFNIEGTRLSYFLNGNSDDVAKERRVCKQANGTEVVWWLRSHNRSAFTTIGVWDVKTDGEWYCDYANAATVWARPAFILPSRLLVTSEGTLSTNTLPTITVDKAENVGTIADGITIKYSVDDEDVDDTLTVTEYLDDVQTCQFPADKKAEQTISYTGNEWLKITNGEHTIKIVCSDSKNDTVEKTVTFTRNCTELSINSSRPFEADDIIRFCSLRVDGIYPTDSVINCEVTNNALDDEPVWEDCTLKVKAGLTYTFKNQLAEKGFAFGFRVTIRRGSGGISGYITKISGGFE